MKQLIKIALLCLFPLMSMAQTPAYQKNPRSLRVTDNGQIYKWKDSIYYDGEFNKRTTYVTPEMYGAIGDGVTDDSSPVQAAINSGKMVFLGSKTYLLGSTINITSAANLVGSGNESILKTTSNQPVLNITSSKVKLSNFSIEGNGRGSATNYVTTRPLQNGVFISGFYFDITISSLFFNNLGNAGIYGYDNTTTSSFNIKNGVNVNSCEFRNNLIGVFWDYEFEFNVVTNSFFRDNEWGIRIIGGNNALHGGQIIRNRKGVSVEAGLNDAHSVVNGVHINQNYDNGVYIDGINNGHIFANCIIMYNSILVNNSRGVTFDGGEYSVQYGITVTGSTNTTIQNINFLSTPVITESGNTRLKFFNNTFVASRPDNMAETIDNLEIVNANGKIPLKINTGVNTVTGDISSMPFGSIRLANSGVSTALPTIIGKSNDNGGLMTVSATNNSNPFPDIVFDVRENDNSDFSTLTNTAFTFSRFQNSLMTILRNGKIGINTILPVTKLHVNESSNGVLTDAITISNQNISAGTETGLFFSPSSTVNNTRGARISALQTDGANSIALKFSTTYNAIISEKIRIHPQGGVSIGNTVDKGAGTLNVTGTVTASPALLGTELPTWSQTTSSPALTGSPTSATKPTTATGLLRLTDLGTGWAQYSDNVYTVGSPLVINSGTTATIPNNAATSITNQLPFGVTALFNPATSKVTPELNGDSYLVNVRFTASSSSNSGLADIFLDVTGAVGALPRETISLRKGAGNTQQINVIFDVYSGSAFVANGGLIKLNSIDGNTSIYDISYKVTRTAKAK